MKKIYDIAAYVWPAYTGREPRTRIFWKEGIGEWQSVKNSAPKENGYHWNRKPLWGYRDEADPEVMEQQIDEATRHGVNVFIYDWYWYDGRPFLENCLNDGFLKAKNCDKMKFYLMWANHDANYCWSRDLSDDFGGTVVWKGQVDRKEYEKIVDRIINNYFKQPNYYKINGCPVFMIYDVKNLISGLGGLEQAKDAIQYFREQTRLAGFPDLHLQFTLWSEGALNLSGFDSNMTGTSKDVANILGADSVTNYQFVHFVKVSRDYEVILEDVKKEWARVTEEYTIPYFPHVSCGWDNNPRFKRFIPNLTTGNTPEKVKKAFESVKEFVDSHPELPAPLITVNSWNEWTESSYLMPDVLYGYGYLDAIKDVFLKDED